MMTSHPSRGRPIAESLIKDQDGRWVAFEPAQFDLGRDGLGKNDETRATAAGIVAAALTGYAVKDQSGRARTVVEFSGDTYDAWVSGRPVTDPVLLAFINPRDGSLRRDELEAAARLLLERQ